MPFWWPLDLPLREENAFHDFRRRMIETPMSLDTALVDAVSQQLEQMMSRHIAGIIERDSLPHLSHVLNGWGDAVYDGVRIRERLVDFVHNDRQGRPFILQCDPEGEFHPWQSFAYAVMAGIDPDTPLRPGTLTLRELALNSRYLSTTEGRELGHLLFGLAYLDPKMDGGPFSLEGDICDLERLMQLAVDAHHYGTFEVCRKFHLTEGLCAVAAMVERFQSYRADAQGFLNGQLDMLLLLGLILQEARQLIVANKPAEHGTLIQELRDIIIVGNFLENHCYYAGHIIELAAFAESLGYQIAPEHRCAMAFVVNELNSTIPLYLPHTQFEECFLHFGHYRRAITLMAEMQRLERGGPVLTRSDLARFTCDFDARGSDDEIKMAATAPHGVYELAFKESQPRSAFLNVVEQYRLLAPPHLAARGRGAHYRRIGPRGWPRALHYELLDYGGPVGVEIHLESDLVRHHAEHVRSLLEGVSRRLPDRTVEWDQKWMGGCGRLRVLFRADAPPETVAGGMLTLIEETLPRLDAALRAANEAHSNTSTQNRA